MLNIKYILSIIFTPIIGIIYALINILISVDYKNLLGYIFPLGIIISLIAHIIIVKYIKKSYTTMYKKIFSIINILVILFVSNIFYLSNYQLLYFTANIYGIYSLVYLIIYIYINLYLFF